MEDVVENLVDLYTKGLNIWHFRHYMQTLSMILVIIDACLPLGMTRSPRNAKAFGMQGLGYVTALFVAPVERWSQFLSTIHRRPARHSDSEVITTREQALFRFPVVLLACNMQHVRGPLTASYIELAGIQLRIVLILRRQELGRHREKGFRQALRRNGT